MHDDLEGKTNVDLDPVRFAEEEFLDPVAPSHEPPHAHPSSIAPLGVDVQEVRAVSDLNRSRTFSWPPPEPAKASATSIVAVGSMSALVLLGLVASFALSGPPAVMPGEAFTPRVAHVSTAKEVVFTSAQVLVHP